MAKRVFFSFHYVPDAWRVAQIRNAGVVEGNAPVSDNDWQTVTKKGDSAIEQWIHAQLSGRSCAVVMIGGATAGRKWINYEIRKAWNDGKGVVGVHIHNLKNAAGLQAVKGANPFLEFAINDGRTNLASIARVYDPPYVASTSVYDHIRTNLAAWVDEAVRIRSNY